MDSKRNKVLWQCNFEVITLTRENWENKNTDGFEADQDAELETYRQLEKVSAPFRKILKRLQI